MFVNSTRKWTKSRRSHLTAALFSPSSQDGAKNWSHNYELQFRKTVLRNRDPFETFLFGSGILHKLLPRVSPMNSTSVLLLW